MVFLSILLAASTAQAAPPAVRPWGLDHVGVAMLPVPDHPLASQLRRGVAAGIESGVVLVPLSDTARTRLNDQPACRERPRCLREVLHPELTLTLDARVEGSGADTRLTVRLLTLGIETDRRSIYLQPNAVSSTVAAEVRTLLLPYQLDFQAYERAVSGDSNAAAVLEQRFPDSPWTAAWRARDTTP